MNGERAPRRIGWAATATNDGSLFVDDATGAVLSSQGVLEASKVFEGFQSSLDEFGVRFGP